MKAVLVLVTFFYILIVPVAAQNGASGAPIKWGRLLRVTDFNIIKPGNKIPPSLENNMALTRTGFTYSIASFTKGRNKGKVEVAIYAAMYPSNSYILERVLKASQSSIDYLLNHEQKHFDISEIYAREACDQLEAMQLTKNFSSEIATAMRKLFQEAASFQNQYDVETNNGRNKEKQLEWNTLIDARLRSLDSFEKKKLLLSIN